MTHSPSVLKIDAVPRRFATLLQTHGTSMAQPSVLETWNAFAAFALEPLECRDDRLFFEADLSVFEPDHFYVHFVRTAYGLGPQGHDWSYEIICDFLFPLDEELEEFNCSIEADELQPDSPERMEFINRVRLHQGLFQALKGREPKRAEIYVGES